MFKYRIITDSSCGISEKEANELGITVLPLTLSLNGVDYRDEIDITTDKFYELMFDNKKSEFPKTSQTSPNLFVDAFTKCKENGEIPVVLPIAASLSGTIRAAQIAKDMMEDEDIYIVDSKKALGCIRVMIRAILKKQYNNIDELLENIKYLQDHMCFYSIVDTLEYLYKGGRLSKTSALIGNILQVKPVIMLNEIGKLEPIAKVRGLKHAFIKVEEFMKENPVDPEYVVDYGYSTKLENVNTLIDYTKELVGKNYTLNQISPVVGAHVGPGASAIFYISTNKVKK